MRLMGVLLLWAAVPAGPWGLDQPAVDIRIAVFGLFRPVELIARSGDAGIAVRTVGGTCPLRGREEARLYEVGGSVRVACGGRLLDSPVARIAGLDGNAAEIELRVPGVMLGAPYTGARQAPPASAARPNVVLIMSDDMGYGDLSSYGATDIKTPNIDGIGKAGARLTDFYANGVLCSPTRAGLMSGRWQQRYFIETALGGSGSRGLKVTGNSLPQVLKNHGYATGLVGKWHLGGTKDVSPMAHGFEYFFGHLSGGIDYYHHTTGGNADLWENDKPITQEGYMTDLITDRSLAFIERSAAAKRPFFIDVAYNAPHWPYQPPGKPSPAPGTSRQQTPQEENTATRADYAAMVEAVDKGVGRILATLDRLGLANNTIVIFTNDNGGEWLSSNKPLWSRKWTVWEGGIRVPALIKWPGRIPAGQVSRQVGITMDLTTSIVAATGAPLPADARYEGVNLFSILERRTPEVERTLYWRVTQNRTQRAIRSGDWKLVVDGSHVMVFNLVKDIGERNDLTYSRSDIAQKLRPMLTKWEAEVDAEALVHEPELAAAAQQTGARAGGAAGGAGRGAAGGGRRGGGAGAGTAPAPARGGGANEEEH